MPRIRLLLLLLCFPLIVGCEGCRNNPDDKAKKDEDEAPLQDFTSRPALAFPADSNLAGGGIKPGHWVTASQSLKSNKVDIRGELLSQSTVSKTNILTGDGTSQTRSGIRTSRPIVLPKGQMRRFDFRLLPPVPTSTDSRRMTLNSRFLSAGRSTFFDTGKQPFNVMSSEEFFLVILTKRPERFARLQVADWVRPPRGEEEFKSGPSNYRVVIPDTKNMLAFPETMLDLTSTAVVFWDDLGPESLTPQQITALADWVRFGGQLVVNGAAGANAIANTAMADVLALAPTSNIELDPDSAATMLKQWEVSTDRSTEKQIALLRGQSGRIAVDGQLANGATEVVNTANLVLNRRIGRGRVIQPRFDLTADWMQSWQSYDSFINAVVLMRPARKTFESDDIQADSMFGQTYPDYDLDRSLPMMNSRLRIAARDAVLNVNTSKPALSSRQQTAVDPFHREANVSGICGWNDSSDTVNMYRQLLRDESGIEIPEAKLVIRSLGYYLLLLVPINYLIFRLLGRLEYAWLAVPFIALGGAVWVARAARLDIGFARSQTEIALLELQPNYPRGHLSRVVAIYNSLSSNYEIEFKTFDAAAMPIAEGSDTLDAEETLFKVSYGEGPTLSGLSVGSNRIRMIHTEQIVDMGGAITRQGDDLVNGSNQELYDVYLIEKLTDGETRIAIVGSLPAGSRQKIELRELSNITVSDELPMQTAKLIRRLGSPLVMPAGSTRLVGRIDDAIDGMTITPSANQKFAQTIVLAHLQHASLPTPKPDFNLISDFRRVQTGVKQSVDEDAQ